MKKSTWFTPVLIGLLLGLSSALSAYLKPMQKMADQLKPLSLDQSVPESFGEWTLDQSTTPITVSADVQEKLDSLYNQTLSRTYVNKDGQRLMLLIAYGADQQGDGTQVHRPEFCYTAQGFNIARSNQGQLNTNLGSFPVRRLLAEKGNRSEPITYWITVGDKVSLPGLNRKLNQLYYGLSGKIPDGMLVRVSSIERDAEHAYLEQDKFINEMLMVMKPDHRVRIAGKF